MNCKYKFTMKLAKEMLMKPAKSITNVAACKLNQ